MVAGQTGADLERVKEIEKVCPLENMEMEPGMCTHYEEQQNMASTCISFITKSINFILQSEMFLSL